MTITVYVFIGLLALVAFISLFWRLGSRRFSLPCPVWLRWLVELDNPFTRIARAREIIDHLDLRPGMSVLDMGCGPGRLSVPVAHAVGAAGRVVAVDSQAGMLRRAREKALRANVANIEFVEANAGEGRPGREAFDRALLVSVLGEIRDRERALAEIFEALRPGGVLSVTEVIFDPHFQRRELVRRLAMAAGFREKAFFGNRIAFTLNLERPIGA